MNVHTSLKNKASIKKLDSAAMELKSLSKDSFLQKRFENFSLRILFFGLGSLAFFLYSFYVFAYRDFSPSSTYVVYFLMILGSHLVGSIFSGKIFLTNQHDAYEMLRKLNLSFFLTVGLFILLLLSVKNDTFSRIIILGSMLMSVSIEAVYLLFVYGIRHADDDDEVPSTKKDNKHPYRYIILEFTLLASVVLGYRLNYNSATSMVGSELVLYASLFIAWVFAGLSSHKFNIVESSDSLLQGYLLMVKGYVIQAALAALSLYYLNIPNAIDWLNVVALYVIASSVLFFLFYAKKINEAADRSVKLFLSDYEGRKIRQTSEYSKYAFCHLENGSSFPAELEHDFLKDYPGVFGFINKTIDLKSFLAERCRIRRTSDVYNFEILKNNSMEMIVNLQRINDIRRINFYLRAVNGKLLPGGVFVGCVLPNIQRFDRIIEKYPGGIGHFVYLFDFIWRRVFIKMPVIRHFYFWVTKGKDRAISLAETLGRLVFNGFEIINLSIIGDDFYFIAKKSAPPIEDNTPKYRLVFKMRRIGLNGNPITVYKIRTMHPYSEYIQKFLYEQSNLDVGGKFKNDFRITSWGKVLRKLWIDELPMLLNLFRGELKLVGVRPLSSHYLSLYSESFREYRNRFKPGLLPPYYADMPETIDEIEQSEKAYLTSYEKSPLITDIRYFFKAFFNIIIRRKRSA